VLAYAQTLGVSGNLLKDAATLLCLTGLVWYADGVFGLSAPAKEAARIEDWRKRAATTVADAKEWWAEQRRS